jgi:methylenetetrahydrofolate reductase (NADPH)
MTSSNGNLETALGEGKFVITAETSPPDSTDPQAVLDRAGCLKGVADAVNVTDGAGARSHMSAFAATVVLAQNGIEPVLQFTTRDRNRLALQGDLIGAGTFGIPNILCLNGDDVSAGDQPETKPVHDLDSRSLMGTARQMRDEGCLPSGRKLDPPPRLFIGGAEVPRQPDENFNTDGIIGKIDAGAHFFQTQFAFDMDVLRAYMARLWDDGIPEKAYFIIGLGPLASAKSARWMSENLFGVHVPEPVINRLEGAEDQRAEGKKICVELMQEMSEIKGIHGVHLMGPRVEEAVAEVVRESGLR